MKVLVVGLGSMGKRRIRMLRRFLCAENIIGVDIQAERRKFVETEYGIECFPDMDVAIETAMPSCGFICTSPKSHYAIAVKLLTHTMSVFSEINLINENHENLIRLAQEHGVKFFLSSTPLYSKERQYIAKVSAEQKQLTYIYHVGQYLPDWHPWESYQNFFVGDKSTNGCREIFAIEFPWIIQSFGMVTSVSVVRKNISTLNIDYPDTYIINITHENGNIGTLCVDIVSRRAVRELTVFNEDIYLTWGGTADTVSLFSTKMKKMQKVEIHQETEQEEGYAEFINEISYYNEVAAFFAYLDKGIEPFHTLTDDIKVLKLIDTIEGVEN